MPSCAGKHVQSFTSVLKVSALSPDSLNFPKQASTAKAGVYIILPDYHSAESGSKAGRLESRRQPWHQQQDLVMGKVMKAMGHRATLNNLSSRVAAFGLVCGCVWFWHWGLIILAGPWGLDAAAQRLCPWKGSKVSISTCVRRRCSDKHKAETSRFAISKILEFMFVVQKLTYAGQKRTTSFLSSSTD